jgi:hypothetical protein
MVGDRCRDIGEFSAGKRLLADRQLGGCRQDSVPDAASRFAPCQLLFAPGLGEYSYLDSHQAGSNRRTVMPIPVRIPRPSYD